MPDPSSAIRSWDIPMAQSDRSTGFGLHCKNFSEGRRCKLYNQGLCPSIHDAKVHSAALAEMKESRAVKKAAALHKKKQQGHTAAKTKVKYKGSNKMKNSLITSNLLPDHTPDPLNILEKKSHKGKKLKLTSIIEGNPSKNENESVNIPRKLAMPGSADAASKSQVTRVAKNVSKRKSEKKINSEPKSIEVSAPKAPIEEPNCIETKSSYVTTVCGSAHTKTNASKQPNWKKNPAILASRLKVQEKYKQLKNKNSIEAPLKSLQLVHVSNQLKETTFSRQVSPGRMSFPKSYRDGEHIFKGVSNTSGEDMVRLNSTINLVCILKFYVDAGEPHSLVLVPHEEVSKFVKGIEDAHHIEICRNFIQGKACSVRSIDECPHSHDLQFRQKIWKDMGNYMRTNRPNYNQTQRRFISKVTKYDPETKKTIAYVPIAVSKEVVPNSVTKFNNARKDKIGATTRSSPLKGKDWENGERVGLLTWARANLSLETRAKYLKSYLVQGKVPLEAGSIFPENSKRGDVFQRFSQLPGELRNQIWEYAIDSQPLDCLIKQGWEYKVDGAKCGRRLEHMSCNNPFLYVNKESRSLTLPRHELTFGTIFHRPQILFDYERDRLFLITQGSMDLCYMVEKLFLRNDRRRIKYLMVPLRDYLQNRDDTCRAITSFSRLKHVWFVVGDGSDENQWSHSRTEKKLTEHMRLMWTWRFRKQKPELVPRTPTVFLNVISAKAARGLQIDGCQWV